ncbi:MAG TPA: ATP-binding protein [Polyangium sp.]|jgi:DNA polymerase III delta prime subunit|nr:ATP-binding protein [Polyangium sp.]
MIMSETVVKFRKLTQVFDPIYRPYADVENGPGGSYVAEAHEDYRKSLVQALELNDHVKWLVAGQPGCGKTTLLLHVVQHLRRQGRFVVFADLENLVSVHDLSWIELHLAVIYSLIEEVRKCSLPVSPNFAEPVRGWLERLDLRGGVGGNLAAVGAAMKQVLETARLGKDLRDEVRDQVKRTGQDPLGLLRAMLAEIDAHRPIVIVDGVDKLQPDHARRKFLSDDSQIPFENTPGSTVLTIPISLVYEPAFNLLSEHFNNADSAVLAAVRLYDFDAKNRRRQLSEKGLDVLERVIRARIDPIDPDIISRAGIQRAIVGSGGNMRELARLLQASVIKAHVREAHFLDEEHVAAAIADRRESYRRALSPEFRPVLEKVRKEYQLEGPGEITRLLLYGLWVMEYRNGETWYSLPNPVEQLLESLERRGA